MSEYLNLASPLGPTAAVGGGPHGSGGPTPPGPRAAAVGGDPHGSGGPRPLGGRPRPGIKYTHSGTSVAILTRAIFIQSIYRIQFTKLAP